MTTIKIYSKFQFLLDSLQKELEFKNQQEDYDIKMEYYLIKKTDDTPQGKFNFELIALNMKYLIVYLKKNLNILLNDLDKINEIEDISIRFKEDLKEYLLCKKCEGNVIIKNISHKLNRLSLWMECSNCHKDFFIDLDRTKIYPKLHSEAGSNYLETPLTNYKKWGHC